MKLQVETLALQRLSVAPLAGAWIEIILRKCKQKLVNVAPLAGAWIEMLEPNIHKRLQTVAPLAGAWIEIANSTKRI